MKKALRFPWLIVFVLCLSAVLIVSASKKSADSVTCKGSDHSSDKLPSAVPDGLLWENVPHSFISQPFF